MGAKKVRKNRDQRRVEGLQNKRSEREKQMREFSGLSRYAKKQDAKRRGVHDNGWVDGESRSETSSAILAQKASERRARLGSMTSYSDPFYSRPGWFSGTIGK